jgi:DNA-binding response OmpR family regulator
MARILVMEDDPACRHAVSATLTDLGHRVTEACNGKEGIALLPVTRADLIITEIVVPETAGFEVLRQIQQHSSLAKVIVTLGGRLGDMTDYAELAKYLGASSVLEKPFLLQELVAAVSLFVPVTQAHSHSG